MNTPITKLAITHLTLPLILLSAVLVLAQPCRAESISFAEVGKLTTGRATHTAITLPDGRVLAAGGASGSKIFSSAELYDPATGVWTDTRNMKSARFRFAGTLLADGRVLEVGGRGKGGAITGAEIFDPARGSWKSDRQPRHPSCPPHGHSPP